jgi:fumarate hydratase class II
LYDAFHPIARLVRARLRTDENSIRESMERLLMRVGTRPKSGYDNAAKVATSALGRGTTLKQKGRADGLCSPAEFDRIGASRKYYSSQLRTNSESRKITG